MNLERALGLVAVVGILVAIPAVPTLFERRAAPIEMDAIELDHTDWLGAKPVRAGTRGAELASKAKREGTEPSHSPDSRNRGDLAGQGRKARAGNDSLLGTARAPSEGATVSDADGDPSSGDGSSKETGQPPVDRPPAGDPPPPPPEEPPAPEQPPALVVAPPPAEVEVQAGDDDDVDDDAEAGLEAAEVDIEDE